MVLQSPPHEGLRQRVCLCSALPCRPLGTQGTGDDQVICPPGGPPAPAAVLGGCPPAKAPPGSQAQRASPHPWATCADLSLQWPVPQTCATLHTGQVRWLHGMCWSGTELALSVAEHPWAQAVAVRQLGGHRPLLLQGQHIFLMARIWSAE